MKSRNEKGELTTTTTVSLIDYAPNKDIVNELERKKKK